MLYFLSTVINYKTVLSSYISAIGYGIGYSFPNAYGIHPFICFIISMIAGMPFDIFAEKSLAYKPFVGSKKRKIVFASMVYITYFVAWYFVNKFLVYDLDEDFFSNLLLILIFQTVAFIMYFLRIFIKKKIKVRKNVK